MCLKCRVNFTIHSLEELKTFLRNDNFNGMLSMDVVDAWFERGYIDNLLYLEWKSEYGKFYAKA